MKIIQNPDKEIINSIKNRLKITNNMCPCVSEDLWNEDYKCPCKKFREEQECCCGLFLLQED